MKKRSILILFGIILLFGIFLLMNQNFFEKQAQGKNIADKDTSDIVCNISLVISKFINLPKGSYDVDGFYATSILKCDYNNQDIYYFSLNVPDGGYSIYDSSCKRMVSAGGFPPAVTGNINISKNMKNCMLLWYSASDPYYLVYAKEIMNRTNSI